jgi:ketosteroid isomerase-like protein
MAFCSWRPEMSSRFMMAVPLFAALLPLQSGSLEAAPGKEEPVEETILSLEKGAMERWRHGDPMGWAEISAQEVTYIDPSLTKPIVGIEEYTAYLKPYTGSVGYDVSEFINPKVVVLGSAAVLTYNYQSGVTTPEGTVKRSPVWNTTEVYFLVDGKWRIAHTHWSYVNHKLPELVEVPIPVELSRQEHTGILGEVMGLESAAMERWRKGDPWGFIEISAPGVTYFDTGTPRRLEGLEALTAEYKQREGKIHYDVMEFLGPRVQVHGDLAVLTYRFFSTTLKQDGSIAGRMPWNCTEVFARSEGKWKIVHTHWSLIKGEPSR